MKTDKDRLISLIETDREELNEESARAAEAEFSRIAEEFFETVGKGSLSVEQGKRDIVVTYTVRAKRVKNFIALK